MTNRKLPTLAQLLSRLRDQAGMSLREVEKATGDEVSNVYLSQLEHGTRRDPNPRVLVHLANVYGCPVRELFEAAGYVDPPTPTDIDRAFEQVLADKRFTFGTRFKGELDQNSKRAVIELYEQAANKKLLSSDDP